MKDKIIIGILIIVLVFLVLNMAGTIWYNIDYEQRKESGNDRWLQVENRILQTEHKVNLLEKEIMQWKK